MTRMMLAVAAVLFAVMPVSGQYKQAGASKPVPPEGMDEYSIAFLKKGPKRDGAAQDEAAKIMAGHLAHIREMGKSGKLAIAGPFVEDGDIRGVFIFRVSLEEAKKLASNDPGVKAGYFDVDVQTWWAEKGLGAAFKELCEKSSPETHTMAQYQFGFLRRGAGWTPEKTPETAKIQEGHMAHLEAMWKAGKMHAAGPMINGGDLRGLVIYRVSSLDEAKVFAEQDPAVKAGRLAVDFHPWMIAEGLIPVPKGE